MKKILFLLLFATLSFAQGISVITYPLTFSTATNSDTLNLNSYFTQGYRVGGIQCDSSNAGTTLTLKVSADGVRYGDLKDIDGTAIGAFTVTANNENIYAITLAEAVQFNYCYMTSDQTETCNVNLILWKQE